MKTFRLIKSSLGITIFLFSFYIVIKMLFFQKDFSLIIYFSIYQSILKVLHGFWLRGKTWAVFNYVKEFIFLIQLLVFVEFASCFFYKINKL